LLKSWDGIFFFIAKNNVQDLRELFWLWQKKHTHVCFKDKYNLSEEKNKSIQKTLKSGQIFLNFKGIKAGR